MRVVGRGGIACRRHGVERETSKSPSATASVEVLMTSTRTVKPAKDGVRGMYFLEEGFEY